LWKCPTSEISQLIDHFWQAGLFVILVTEALVILNWWLNHALLAPHNFSSFSLIIITFIAAGGIYVIRNILNKYMPNLYMILKRLWPLLLLQGFKLGFSSAKGLPSYNFVTSFIFGIAFTVGWGLRILLFAAIREQLSSANIPKIFDGLGITVIIVIIMSLAFMGFGGII
jgi:Na+-transporting NADH:ubiquinone oxidoreductase subunit E